MINEEENVTIKKSSMVLQMSLKRSKGGLQVFVKADLMIEELFREWGQNVTTSVENYDHRWKGENLRVYNFNIYPDGMRHFNAGNVTYNLHNVGTQLIDEDNFVTLGFLRLVGISEGVTFTVDGVYSADGIRKMREWIKHALRHFYVNFVKPVDMVLTISATEM
jgi:hypothetical protein